MGLDSVNFHRPDHPVAESCCSLVPSAVVAAAGKFPRTSYWLRTLVLVGVFVVADLFFKRAGYLWEPSYHSPVLVIEVLARLGPLLGIGLSAIAVVLLKYGGLFDRWESIETGRHVRWVIVIVVAALAWFFATLPYNHYYDQAYTLDRILIVALVPLIVWRPMFVYLFVLLAYAFLWQLDQPQLSAGASFPHKVHLLHVLTAFCVSFGIHAVFDTRRLDGFLILSLCLIGTAYWEPALTKLQLDWLNHGHLYRMLLAAHAHGWLAGMDGSSVVAWARVIERADLAMQIFTLLVEIACLFIFWKRRLTIGLLLGLSLFHVGVFLLYGYLFWTWILLNLLLAGFLIAERNSDRFGGHRALLAGLLVAGGSLWAHPSELGWYDTRLTYTYRYRAVGESGEMYVLPPRFFEPYGDIFTMANFGYLPKSHKMLVFPYGTTRIPEIAQALNATTTAESVFSLEATLGLDRHDPDLSLRFYQFITRFVQNHNLGGTELSILEKLGPPPQFWSAARGDVYAGQEIIEEVRVMEVTTLFDETELNQIRTIELARLEIPRSGGTAIAPLP